MLLNWITSALLWKYFSESAKVNNVAPETIQPITDQRVTVTSSRLLISVVGRQARPTGTIVGDREFHGCLAGCCRQRGQFPTTAESSLESFSNYAVAGGREVESLGRNKDRHVNVVWRWRQHVLNWTMKFIFIEQREIKIAHYWAAVYWDNLYNGAMVGQFYTRKHG